MLVGASTNHATEDVHAVPWHQRLKNAEALGSRDALDAMGNRFKEMDTDGNGVLTMTEFVTGMTNFDKSMSISDAEVLFKHLDADGSGTLDLEEFISMQKRSLEMKDLLSFTETRKSSCQEMTRAIDVEKKRMMKAIEEGGVRLQRTMSTVSDPKLQGDLRMVAPAVMAQRLALKKSPQIQALISSWWKSMGLEENGEMNETTYLNINMALHFSVCPDLSDEEALETAHDDWLDDMECLESDDRTTMRYPAFFEAMYQVCDTWVDTTDEDDYVEFGTEMREAYESFMRKQEEKEKYKPEQRSNEPLEEVEAGSTGGGGRRAAAGGTRLTPEIREVEDEVMVLRANPGSELTEAQHIITERAHDSPRAHAPPPPQVSTSSSHTSSSSSYTSSTSISTVAAAAAATPTITTGTAEVLPANTTPRLSDAGKASLTANKIKMDAKQQEQLAGLMNDDMSAQDQKLTKSMGNMNKESKAVVMSVMGELDTGQKGEAFAAMAGLRTADQKSLGKVLAGLSKEEKAAMLSVMADFDAGQKAQLLGVLDGLSAAEQEALLTTLTNVSKAGKKAILNVTSGLNAEQKQVFIEILGNLSSEDQARVAMLMRSMTAEEQAAFLARAANLSPEDLKRLLMETQKKTMRLYYSYCTGCNPSWQTPYVKKPEFGVCSGPTHVRRQPEFVPPTCHSCGKSSAGPKPMRTRKSTRIGAIIRRAVKAAQGAAAASASSSASALQAVEAVIRRQRMNAAAAVVPFRSPSLPPPSSSIRSQMKPWIQVNMGAEMQAAMAKEFEGEMETTGVTMVLAALPFPEVVRAKTRKKEAKVPHTVSRLVEKKHLSRSRRKKKATAVSAETERAQLIETWMRFPDIFVDPTLLIAPKTSEKGRAPVFDPHDPRRTASTTAPAAARRGQFGRNMPMTPRPMTTRGDFSRSMPRMSAARPGTSGEFSSSSRSRSRRPMPGMEVSRRPGTRG
jgi:hypothetical protein